MRLSLCLRCFSGFRVKKGEDFMFTLASNCTQCDHNTALLKTFCSQPNVTALVNVTLHSGLLHSFRLQGLSLSHLERDGRTVAASGSGDRLSVVAPVCFPEPLNIFSLPWRK